MSKKDRFGCCDQPHANSPLWDGPGFSRRQFFQVAGSALSGYYFTRLTRPLEVMAATKVTTKNTAKNCVFIFLAGAASHVDTFDLKEGAWLPADFAPTSYGDIRFPQGLMPNLANHLNKLAIVRSAQSWAAVHGLATTWTQIARNPAAALGKISPNIGAVVALEKETAGSKLPGFVALNANGIVGSGYLSSRYSPFGVAPNPTGLPSVAHPDGKSRFDGRIRLLDSMDTSLRQNSPLGRPAEDMSGFYKQAQGMMYDTEVDATFRFTNEERWRYGIYPAGNGPDANNPYGINAFGDACVVTRNIFKSNLGTRYIQINLGGWDNHSAIYNQANGIYPRARQLDGGLAGLLDDLSKTSGSVVGKSLLDETLIVVMGEFGRTVGGVNNQQGRDHYLQQFVVFAGGGVRGGRVIGSTNATGGYTQDPGWVRNRSVRNEDVASSIYTALGIDWTTIRYDDPFGRGFEYIPFAASQDTYGPVTELF